MINTFTKNKKTTNKKNDFLIIKNSIVVICHYHEKIWYQNE